MTPIMKISAAPVVTTSDDGDTPERGISTLLSCGA